MSKKEIELISNKGTIIVDSQDYNLVSKHRWFLVGGYAASKVGTKTVYLHRLIMQPTQKKCVDHINGDRLDNRRQNLRLCSYAENNRNSKKQSNNNNKFKGVTKYKYGWRAQIWHDNKHYGLGSYKTEELAAKAYNKAARELHGDFAKLNNVF